jgi:hypothetical protein
MMMVVDLLLLVAYVQHLSEGRSRKGEHQDSLDGMWHETLVNFLRDNDMVDQFYW